MSTTGVNKERVRLLVDALRSGEFEQGRGHLVQPSDEDSYKRYAHCCLGVATEIAIRQGCEGVRRSEDCGTRFEYLSANGQWYIEDGALPYRVMEWYGFNEPNPYLPVPRVKDYQHPTHESASVINDDVDEEYDFDDIATSFEKGYLA